MPLSFFDWGSEALDPTGRWSLKDPLGLKCGRGVGGGVDRLDSFPGDKAEGWSGEGWRKGKCNVGLSADDENSAIQWESERGANKPRVEPTSLLFLASLGLLNHCSSV